MIKTICVLSGGMDSTTLLYQLLKEGKEVKAISFYYGQRHQREVEQAKKTCQKLNIEHRIVTLNFMLDLCSNSSLTSNQEVPHGHYEHESMKKTVVPNRNMIFASIAIGWAVNLNYDEVALGVHAGDFEIYPDCRPEFILALNHIAQIANFKPIRIYTPYLNITKGDIAKKGIKLSVDYSISQTCYEGKEKPCMRCGACSERTGSLANAGVKDPLYNDKEWIEAIKCANENGIKINVNS